MKRMIALLLSLVMLLTGCTQPQSIQQDQLQSDEIASTPAAEIPMDTIVWEDDIPQYNSLDDTALLQYVEDNVYAELAIQFGSDDYFIENVTAKYISQEFLDEIEFNSQSNVFFGYTIAELDELFQGNRYIFTLDDDGQTTVQEMQIIKDVTAEEIIKNVAIGTGVILVCVTVSYFTAGAGTPTAVNLIFTAAAKTGTTFALSSGAISGISAGIVRGYQTGDMSEAIESVSLAGSEGFKWGAITGVIAGGSSEALRIYRSTKSQPPWRTSEDDVLDMTDNAVEQVAYLNGKEVSYSTNGCTRPDVVVRNADGSVKAIEVKNYDLETNGNGLLNELKRQISERVYHLPPGSTQEIVLDVRGRGYTTKFINDYVTHIKGELNSIYTNIPVSVLRY